MRLFNTEGQLPKEELSKFEFVHSFYDTQQNMLDVQLRMSKWPLIGHTLKYQSGDIEKRVRRITPFTLAVLLTNGPWKIVTPSQMIDTTTSLITFLETKSDALPIYFGRMDRLLMRFPDAEEKAWIDGTGRIRTYTWGDAFEFICNEGASFFGEITPIDYLTSENSDVRIPIIGFKGSQIDDEANYLMSINAYFTQFFSDAAVVRDYIIGDSSSGSTHSDQGETTNTSPVRRRRGHHRLCNFVTAVMAGALISAGNDD